MTEPHYEDDGSMAGLAIAIACAFGVIFGLGVGLILGLYVF
jgi:hypothetical protein